MGFERTENLFNVIFAGVVFFYGIACWHSIQYYRTLEPLSDRSAVRWLTIGFCLHGILLAGRWALEDQGPLLTLDGIFLSLAFSLAAALLVGRSKSVVPILGSFFLPVVFLLSFIALYTGLGTVPVMESGQMTVELVCHIFLTFLGFAHFTLGFGVGVAFWVQEGQLKSHKVGSFGYRLPALEVLDGLTVFYTALGLLFWGAGLLLGVHEALKVWNKIPFGDPKIMGSFLVLLIYAFFFLVRWGFSMRGKKTMGLVLVGYLLALFTFVGVRVFLTTQHAF